MRLGEALAEDEARVDELLKSTGKLMTALRAWHRACRSGQLPARARGAAQAAELARELVEPTQTAASAWSFDLREYLESGAWREELHDVAAAEPFGLAVMEEQEYLVSSPVTVRAQVAKGVLQIGRKTWSKLHPAVVAEELRRLREGSQLRNAQETVEALYGVWKHQGKPSLLKFRDAFELFCLTPGWKRDNPPISFTQRVHALAQSGLTSTRDGRAFWFEWPSGDPKARDVLAFVAEDGQAIRYYGLVFD